LAEDLDKKKYSDVIKHGWQEILEAGKIIELNGGFSCYV